MVTNMATATKRNNTKVVVSMITSVMEPTGWLVAGVALEGTRRCKTPILDRIRKSAMSGSMRHVNISRQAIWQVARRRSKDFDTKRLAKSVDKYRYKLGADFLAALNDLLNHVALVTQCLGQTCARMPVGSHPHRETLRQIGRAHV